MLIRRPASTRRPAARRTRVLIAVALAASTLAMVRGDHAFARVNPLITISQQIQRGNMLIVLDTSGSMTGSPGGVFVSSSEVGVDCDGGDRCRLVNQVRACLATGAACSGDGDCRTGVCEDDGDPCKQDSDCAQTTAHCSGAPAVSCRYNSDCSPSEGTCTYGGACSSVQPCPQGQCSSTGIACANYGQPCVGGNGGICVHDPSADCERDRQCMYDEEEPPYSRVRYRFWDPDDSPTATPDVESPAGHVGVMMDDGVVGLGPRIGYPDDNPRRLFDRDTLGLDPGDSSLFSGGDFIGLAGATKHWMRIPAAAGSALDINGSYTISVRIYTPDVTPPGVSIVSRRHGATAYDTINVGLDSNERLTLTNSQQQATGGPLHQVTASTQVPQNTWVTLAVTYDAATQTVRLYQNGDEVGQLNGVPAPIASSNDIMVGARWGTAPRQEFFNGAIGELYFFKQALTLGEIRGITKSCGVDMCLPLDNACSVGLSVCTTAITNKCLIPNPNDTCVTGGTAKVPIRMCEKSLRPCSIDANCPTAGDRCVAATSRAAMAKRVLSSVLMRNKSLLNFGLMTFVQSRYYPYYPAITTTTKTEKKFLTKDTLKYAGCWSDASGPAAICTISFLQNTTFTLAGALNSRYRVRTGASDWISVDKSWNAAGAPPCTFQCPTASGTGTYEGSYYTYTVQTGTYSKNTVNIQPTYRGKLWTDGAGKKWIYYEPDADYYMNPMSGTHRPPIVADYNCGSRNSCGVGCGGRWDTDLAPFMNTSPTPASDKATVEAIAQRLEPAWNGGLMMWSRTPIGCTLVNNNRPDPNHSAFHYLRNVMTTDPLEPAGCRQKFVLLVTDGEPNGPGDVDLNGNPVCAAAACASTDPAVFANCKCRSAQAARALHNDHALAKALTGNPAATALGVKTYVVAFSGSVSSGSGKVMADNIARAGGTGQAIIARDEYSLDAAIQRALLDAVAGSYQTSPPVAASGTQLNNGVQASPVLLDSRVDFPAWKGHLIAHDTETGVSWDAATVSFPTCATDPPAAGDPCTTFWKKRRVYTSSGKNLVPIAVDASGTITNAATLFSLGLGNSASEAASIARWMLGDPAMQNPAVLGAIINSTPIDVGQPGASPFPGGRKFHETYKNRPNLIYVGASDGMLHAFFAKNPGIPGYTAGKEAFAYIPPEMLRVVTKIYTNGGQHPSPDEHVFGLASSPKVKNLCVANCTDDDTAQWKTVLVMTEGPGGNEAFALDITNPVSAGGVNDPPFQILWHTQVTDAAQYDPALGNTFSVPAFFFNKTGTLSDERLAFASGYGTALGQGRSLVVANTSDGAIRETHATTPSTCTADHAVLSDVATARNYAAGENLGMLAAYVGDTHGSLWRYTPSAVGAGSMARIAGPDCGRPLHLAPAIVQLDRDIPGNQAHEIYIVQATNSALDRDSQPLITFPASQIVIKKEKYANGAVAPDGSFAPITLTAGTNDVWYTCSSGPNCKAPVPAAARPIVSPLAILKQDGLGFAVFSLWYLPASCNKGDTYLAVHDVTVAGTATQMAGLHLESEPVAGIAVAGGKIFFVSSQGAKEITPAQLGVSLVAGGRAGDTNPNFGRLRVLTWKEVE